MCTTPCPPQSVQQKETLCLLPSLPPRWCCVDSCIHAEKFTDRNELVAHTRRESIISQPKQTHADVHSHSTQHSDLCNQTHRRDIHYPLRQKRHRTQAHTFEGKLGYANMPWQSPTAAFKTYLYKGYTNKHTLTHKLHQHEKC